MSSKLHEELLDKIGGMSVIELSDFVKAFEDKFSVSATMPVAAGVAASTGEASEAVEEKSEFKVTLEQPGEKKIDNIKALRKVTTLGLSEAKAAVENAPTVLAEAVPKEEAQKMKEALEAVGAKVSLS